MTTIIPAMVQNIKSVLARCLELTIPGNCIVCGTVTQGHGRLCMPCIEDLETIDHFCAVCGIPLVESASNQQSCGSCLHQAPPFRQCRSLFHYQAPVDKLITDFKFNARFAAGSALAELLAQAMQRHYQDRTRPETLIPVPLHANRLRKRGYNQALELAKVVSSICRIPVSYRDISRTRDSPPQTKLSAAARRANVRNVFSFSAANRLEGATFVVIIDDVMTTMSTASSIAKLLVPHGVEIVDVWTLARVSQEAILEKTEIQTTSFRKSNYNKNKSVT